MSSCACPGCGQPPGAISCQTAVGAGSSLFTGAMPVMSYAPWAAGMRAVRLLHVPLPLQRGWESPPSFCCPHRAYSLEMGQHQEGSSTRSLASCQTERPTAPQMWSQARVPLHWHHTHVTLMQVYS